MLHIYKEFRSLLWSRDFDQIGSRNRMIERRFLAEILWGS